MSRVKNLVLLIMVRHPPSQDVVDTAKNLIEVINAANTDILAIYWSEVSSESLELPGLIRLIERDFQTAPSFTISATAIDSDDARVAVTWSPNLVGFWYYSSTRDKAKQGLLLQVSRA